MSAVLEPTAVSAQHAIASGTSASKPWLKHYPPGVPAEINPDQYRSLVQLFDESFKTHAQKPFAVCMDVTLRYRQLDELSASFGAWLQAQGLPKGARVALMLPNVLQFPVVMAGILRAGYTCVNVNPLYTPRELEHQLKDSGAEAIIILENFCATLAEVVAKTPVKHVVVASVGDMLGFWKGLLVNTVVRHVRKAVPAFKIPLDGGLKVTTFNRAMADGYRLHLKPADCAPTDIAFLQYTGGTTGLSKGAVLTHRNVLAAVLSADAWFNPAYEDITTDGGTINGIAALPLYHIFALSLAFLAMRGGNMLTLIPNPRDVGGLINELKKRPFHTFPGVNTLFNALLAHPDFKTVDWSKLRVSQAGGMAASEGTATKWAAGTGCNMIEGWGMSETCAIGTNNPVTNKTFTGTIGLPLPSVEIAIKDDDGADVPLGQPGEICIKGPNVMQGYYNKPEENKTAFTADGFMRTGDIGIMDDRGYTKIVDRKKDMILVSGFNVFPNELENVISTCPGVLECAAIGVPDEKSGEAIKVFVVKSDPGLSEDQVASFCRKNLTGYKQPKYIEFRDDLPKTNVGKILRRELRDKK
jgi:acyl-CoA synthetase (AMP-forming)/AMP-acid ligase II